MKLELRQLLYAQLKPWDMGADDEASDEDDEANELKVVNLWSSCCGVNDPIVCAWSTAMADPKWNRARGQPVTLQGEPGVNTSAGFLIWNEIAQSTSYNILMMTVQSKRDAAFESCRYRFQSPDSVFDLNEGSG